MNSKYKSGEIIGQKRRVHSHVYVLFLTIHLLCSVCWLICPMSSNGSRSFAYCSVRRPWSRTSISRRYAFLIVAMARISRQIVVCVRRCARGVMRMRVCVSVCLCVCVWINIFLCVYVWVCIQRISFKICACVYDAEGDRSLLLAQIRYTLRFSVE